MEGDFEIEREREAKRSRHEREHTHDEQQKTIRGSPKEGETSKGGIYRVSQASTFTSVLKLSVIPISPSQLKKKRICLFSRSVHMYYTHPLDSEGVCVCVFSFPLFRRRHALLGSLDDPLGFWRQKPQQQH